MKISGYFPRIFTKVGDLSKKFPNDSKVQIFGLKNTPQHNGKTGVVDGYAEDGTRIYVKIEGSKILSLKPKNLKLVSDESPTTTNPSTADPGALTHSPPPPIEATSTTSGIQHEIDRASVEEAPKNSLPASESTNNQQLKPISEIFPIGSLVQIKGLINQPAYNERYAKVIEYRTNDSGQYERIIVKVDCEDKPISVKRENLVSPKEAYENMKKKCVHDIAEVFRPDGSLDTYVPTNCHAYEELKDKFPLSSVNKIVDLPNNSTHNGSFGVVIDYDKKNGENFICISLYLDSETTLWVKPNNLQNILDTLKNDVISPVLRQIKLQNSPSSR